MRNQFCCFFPKGKFITNVITLTTGTALAQAITILATPIITRLYSPDDFGVLALFTSVSGIFSVVACWRYEQAIVLPKKDEQAVDIFALSISIAFGMTFLTFLVMLFGRKSIASLLGSAKLSSWLWFVPLAVLYRGLYQVLNYWSTRKKKFKHLAISRTSQSVTTAATKIIVGTSLETSVGGLIGGNIAGTVMATAVLCVAVWKDNFLKLLKVVKKSDVWVSAVEYRKFPYYDSWAGLINSFSQQIPVLLLAHFFTPTVVGFYFLANKLLMLPIGLISQSVQKVYFQKASELYASERPMKESFIKSTFGLLGVGIVPFSVVLLFGKPIFVLIFGANWAIAGLYAQIISLWAFAGFINTPARALWIVFQKQDKLLIWDIFLVIFRILSILAGYHFFNRAEKSLVLFSGVGVFFNFLLIGYGYYWLHIYSTRFSPLQDKESK